MKKKAMEERICGKERFYAWSERLIIQSYAADVG